MTESGQAAVEIAMIVAAVSLPIAVALFLLGDGAITDSTSVVGQLLDSIPSLMLKWFTGAK